MDDKERQAVFIAALTTKHFVLQTAASVTVSTEISTLMGERGERVRDPLSTRRKESRLALGSDGHGGLALCSTLLVGRYCSKWARLPITQTWRDTWETGAHRRSFLTLP